MRSVSLSPQLTWQSLLGDRRLSVPFVTAPALTDVKWLFGLIPVWWLLGAEQFIWFPLLFITLARILIASRFKVRLTATAAWLGLFLIVQAMAGLFIVESYRLLTFARTFGLYASAWMLLVVVTHCVTEWREVRVLVRVAVVVMVAAAGIGLIGFFGVWRGTFTTPVGAALPDVIRNTTFGGAVAVKSIGREGYFRWLGGGFYRLTSIFNFSTTFASALALVIPAAFYLLKTGRSTVRQLVVAGATVALLVNFVFTTGRGAILACLSGWMFMVAMTAAVRARVRFVVASATMALALVVGTLTLRPQDTIVPLYEAFLYARGGGSFSGRTKVYRLSLEGVRDRPLFGWGTQRRDVRSLYPLGSHSHHLGVLYKFGGVGFVVSVGMWLALWRDTRPKWKLARKDRDHWEASEFLRYGRWIFAAAVLNGATDVLDLDAITFMLMWLLFSLLVATKVNL